MIKNIEFGIKISSKNFDLIPNIYSHINEIDFIEILLFPDFNNDDIKIIKNLKLKYAIHIPSSNYGINFGDLQSNENNQNYIRKINFYQGYLKPFCYIIHPESGDFNLSIINIKKLNIEPLAIENMPLMGIDRNYLLGYDPFSLEMFFKKIPKLEFCFDINHAIKASISKKINYISFITEFLQFKKPLIFHISGGNLNSDIDEHINLEISDYNLSDIKKILIDYNETVKLTFETPRNYDNNIKDDLKNMKFFLNS